MKRTASPQARPRAWVTWLLVAAVAAIAAIPLLIGAGDHLPEPFPAADDQAEEAIELLAPDHEPLMEPLFEAPSAEIESGLFALQAAVGAGVLGYYFGVVRTRRALGGASGAGAEADTAPGR